MTNVNNNKEYLSDGIKLFVKESVEEVSRDFVKMLSETSKAHSIQHSEFYRRLGTLERTSVTKEEMETLVRPLVDESNKKAGAKSVWIFLAVTAGGIIGSIGAALIHNLLK